MHINYNMIITRGKPISEDAFKMYLMNVAFGSDKYYVF